MNTCIICGINQTGAEAINYCTGCLNQINQSNNYINKFGVNNYLNRFEKSNDIYDILFSINSDGTFTINPSYFFLPLNIKCSVDLYIRKKLEINGFLKSQTIEKKFSEVASRFISIRGAKLEKKIRTKRESNNTGKHSRKKSFENMEQVSLDEI